MTGPPPSALRGWPLEAALLGAAYVATAKLGLAMDAVSGFAALVWPPSGIALAALFVRGRRLWPGVTAGALAANLWAGAPLPVALAIAGGNTLAALAAAWLLERAAVRPALDRVRDVLALVALAALPTPLVSATVGVSALALARGPTFAGFWNTWRAWWLGDLMGDLVVAPLILAWSAAPRLGREPGRIAEALALAAAVCALGLFVFGLPLPAALAPLREPYTFFPLLIWAALRFDQRGVSAAMLLVSAFAVVGAARGFGPFTHRALNERLLYLQAFMGVVAGTALVLGAAVAERRRAVRARDDFLAVAAHELRTPLSALVLQLGALLRSLRASAAGPEDPTVVRAEKAVRVTDRLARLVESLLDVSRVAAGRLVLQREECDLGAIARDVSARVADQARQAGCELRVHAAAPAIGRWDHLRLEQVLANLLSNALVHGAGQPVDVTVAAAADTATLTVQDGGPGIPAGEAARVFDRFEQAPEARNRGGLGLGLYIARQIVAAHRGTIRVSSAPGAGARFVVELPRML